MEVKPKIGIDNLKFGMTRNEIIGILGKPDRTIVDPNNENEVILEWTKKFLRLVFYQNQNDRFAYLRTKNPDLTFNGKKIINRDIKIVTKDVFGGEVANWEIDDFISFVTYFDDNLWISLYVEYEIVEGFELGVTFKNDEEYNWPEF